MISSFTPPQNIILVSPGKFAHSSSFEFEELAIATGGAVSEHFIGLGWSHHATLDSSHSCKQFLARAGMDFFYVRMCDCRGGHLLL